MWREERGKKKRILSGIFCTIVGCSNNYNATEELSGEQVNNRSILWAKTLQPHHAVTCINQHMPSTALSSHKHSLTNKNFYKCREGQPSYRLMQLMQLL